MSNFYNVTIEVNGAKVTVSEASSAAVRELVGLDTVARSAFDDRLVSDIVCALADKNQRIPAIKFVRALRGWGLKEAKDWVDTHCPQRAASTLPPIESFQHARNKPVPGDI